MIICKACGQKFTSKEEYNKHWKYILDTSMRQYNELVKNMEKRMLELIQQNKSKILLEETK